MTEVLKYDFFILSLLFYIPGAVIYLLRSDLRKVIQIMALMSLPFALTEFLFYPQYWQPAFLFDLVSIIGFGIEDFMFVTGFGAFASTGYAFFTGRKYQKFAADAEWQANTVAIFLITASLVILFVLVEIEMIYGSVFIMLLIAGGIVFQRRDLMIPAVAGGGIILLIYAVLVSVYQLILPDVFQIVWKPQAYSNRFIAGIPLEELLYGFAAGTVATVFYPFVFKMKFVKQSKIQR